MKTPAPAPVAQLETVDVLVARRTSERAMPSRRRFEVADVADGLRGAEHDPQDRQAQCHRGIVRLDRARHILDRRTDPGRQADQGQRLRLHGRGAAERHARDLHRNYAGNRRRRIHSAGRPCRRHPVAPRQGAENRAAPKHSSAKPFSRMSASSPSIRRSRKRTARRLSSARPRHSNSRRARPRSSRSGARKARSRSRCAASSTPPASLKAATTRA